MLVTPIKTYRVRHYEQPSLEEVLTDCLPVNLAEKTVVVVTSKIVSLSEGSFVYKSNFDKEWLIKQRSDFYLDRENVDGPASRSHMITVMDGILIPAAGIDYSKSLYILPPADAQYTANRLRAFLAEHYGLTSVGVVITDSTGRPLRRGVTGIALAHSGFMAVVGDKDPKKDVAGGLAAAAVLTMGEGGETRPLATITDVPFVEFVPRDPSAEELADIKTRFDTDLFKPLLASRGWMAGSANTSSRSTK